MHNIRICNICKLRKMCKRCKIWRYAKLNLANETKPDLTYQTKPTRPSLPNQTFQTKFSQPSLLNQTYQTKPNQNYWLSIQHLGLQCLWQCFFINFDAQGTLFQTSLVVIVGSTDLNPSGPQSSHIQLAPHKLNNTTGCSTVSVCILMKTMVVFGS